MVPRAMAEGEGGRAVPAKGAIRGVMGLAYIDLGGLLGLDGLEALDDEICLALSQLPTGYTGGSHRSMLIMPPGREAEAWVDYGEVIAGLSDADYLTLGGLADEPQGWELAARAESTWGEERALGLSRRQMLWLEYKHRVYFPWKVFYELMPNRWWGEKSRGEGKRFTRNAERFFAKTIAFVKRLPFQEIGRCNIMGLQSFDHGTVHRDGEGDGAPDEFVTLCPRPGKRLYLLDGHGPTAQKVAVAGRAYWFNDHDYHGVEADPWFRYSVRVDGVFEPSFRDKLEAYATSLKEAR